MKSRCGGSKVGGPDWGLSRSLGWWLRGGLCLRLGAWLVVGLAAVVPLSVAAQQPAAQAASVPTLPRRAATVAGFVPAGWQIEQQLAADLNHDSRPDLLLLLRTVPAQAGGSAAALSPQRLLAVLLGTSGGYALSAANARLIPQLDLSTQEDPLANGELTVQPGGFELQLGLMASVGSYQSANLHYGFRLQGACWRLVRYDRLETHRATLDTQDLRIDFLTGQVLRTKGNAQTDVSQVQRSRLARQPRLCLPDLGSALSFKPV